MTTYHPRAPPDGNDVQTTHSRGIAAILKITGGHSNVKVQN